ncbi:hypothetical protein [Aquimarina agarivorans]|uniref:hypothetical protein n=1 Tax=Aquimarina agarivorans TaxID=980584 RepID=UPI000248F5A7|nr:hypothetical protein [Aquimarina agarivorans]
MDLLRSEILSITKHRPEIGLSYYNELLDIIDEYHTKKPDTSIETCKAIIEGISKLVIHKIKQEPIHELDKSREIKELAKRALNALNDELQFFDRDFARGIVNVVRILGEIRNGHSDISHGRASIKKQINCPDFSQMIAGFTESMSVYLLKKLDEVVVIENHYDSEQMKDYNVWLDTSIEDFPIATERYSKVLYEYDNALYYFKYENEYLVDEVEEELITEDTESADTKVLLSEINSKFFTEEKQKEFIRQLAEEEQLNPKKLTELLDRFFFDNEFPSKGKITELFIYGPTDEKTKVLVVERKIDELIEDLAKIL